MKLSLVIPTYNEVRNIQELCPRIIAVLQGVSFDFEIIIVDDDSPDLTWKAAEDLRKRYPQIKVIRRLNQRGLASAVVCGWQASRGEILGVLDGDLQHPAEILKKMVNRILADQEIDIVIASRYILGGGSSKNSFWERLRSGSAIFLGRVLAPKILKLAKDPMSGYFILRKEVILGKRFKPVGYKILLEVLAVGRYRKICEIPYIFGFRRDGRTKADWKQYFLYLIQLTTLNAKRKLSALNNRGSGF